VSIREKRFKVFDSLKQVNTFEIHYEIKFGNVNFAYAFSSSRIKVSC